MTTFTAALTRWRSLPDAMLEHFRRFNGQTLTHIDYGVDTDEDGIPEHGPDATAYRVTAPGGFSPAELDRGRADG